MQEHKISKVSKRVQKEKVSRWRTGLMQYGVLCIVLYILALVVSHRIAWSDMQVSVDIPKTIQYEELRLAIDELQERSRLLFFIRRDNAPLFPRKNITEDLLETFPRIASLDIKKNWKGIHYGLTERNSEYIACIKDTDLGPCWYMDRAGILFDEAPAFSPGVYTTFILDAKPTSLPARPFEPELLEQLHAFNAGFEAHYEGSIESVEITERDITIDVLQLFHQAVPSGSQIVLDKVELTTQDGAEDVFKRLALARDKGPFLAELRARPTDFLYLDMRFPDKFYFKFNEH